MGTTTTQLPIPFHVDPITKSKVPNTLIIGDLHAPFILDGYLEFCQSIYKKHQCTSVIFIGDIVDSHAWSFHEHDPDGMSVGDELAAAKKRLRDWYKAFPVAKVMLGNHDELIARKAKAAGLSKKFLKPLGEVLEAPSTWEFLEEIYLGDVLVTHGNSGDAIKKAMLNRVSMIQGHFHSAAYVQWSVSIKDALFGMQVGCGIDRHAYAMAYGKPFAKKPIISCGVLLDDATLPLIELMKL